MEAQEGVSSRFADNKYFGGAEEARLVCSVACVLDSARTQTSVHAAVLLMSVDSHTHMCAR